MHSPLECQRLLSVCHRMKKLQTVLRKLYAVYVRTLAGSAASRHEFLQPDRLAQREHAQTSKRPSVCRAPANSPYGLQESPLGLGDSPTSLAHTAGVPGHHLEPWPPSCHAVRRAVSPSKLHVAVLGGLIADSRHHSTCSLPGSGAAESIAGQHRPRPRKGCCSQALQTTAKSARPAWLQRGSNRTSQAYLRHRTRATAQWGTGRSGTWAGLQTGTARGRGRVSTRSQAPRVEQSIASGKRGRGCISDQQQPPHKHASHSQRRSTCSWYQAQRRPRHCARTRRGHGAGQRGVGRAENDQLPALRRRTTRTPESKRAASRHPAPRAGAGGPAAAGVSRAVNGHAAPGRLERLKAPDCRKHRAPPFSRGARDENSSSVVIGPFLYHQPIIQE